MNPAKMTIKEVKEFLFAHEELTEETQALFSADTRSGVQAAYKQWQRRREKAGQLRQRWLDMSKNERELWNKGYTHIAGLDEVGRGPLAGPVVTAAVILPQDFYLPGLNDSKKVPPARRETMYEQIMAQAVAVSVTLSDAALIDEINIFQATLRAMRMAVQELSVTPDITLNDAVTVPGLSIEQRPIIGGDGKSVSIAAASIVAKVERDRIMKKYDEQYPGYGFASNMGYGTAEHLAALRKLGPCPIHRRSFGGVLTP
ncbi:ribonuclease HII [Aneurinibacillus danicus]|jgi:ribonuclease HII|uniref:Ribonuclease HII n=1 Tax=Aneurinibacillus danicus TaxID=267746 RepID=A0A511V5A9_9BACL|nr:ribonuclease HII [Aneurinibacillus danicus]GEN34125.1 ribonuclease HII [Aneurinibacillus danicus]